jgi:hypothetical protein
LGTRRLRPFLRTLLPLRFGSRCNLRLRTRLPALHRRLHTRLRRHLGLRLRLAVRLPLLGLTRRLGGFGARTL